MTAPWPLAIEVELTDEEIAAFTTLATRRATPERSKYAWWWDVLLGALGGFVLAGLVVLSGAVRPERAGPVAGGGFVLFWAGMWWQYALARASGRRQRRAAWARIDRRFTLDADADGVRVSVRDMHSWQSWSRTTAAERLPGAIVLWSDRATLLPLPDRCLPPGTDPAALAAAIGEAVAQARQGVG